MKKIIMLKSLIITSFFISLFLFSGCNSTKEVNAQTDSKSSAQTQINQINISLSEITEKAKWYNYEVDNKTISYFAVKASDGRIKVAFDACDICYPEKKGYRQVGSDMICNYCGLKFAIIGIGTENKASGGCWPGYLPATIEGDYLKISKQDLENGKWRF